MEHLMPRQAHDFVQNEPDVLFIDCRSDAEYFFVGHALGSMHVAWVDAPDWEVNPEFVADVKKLAGHSMQRPVVLICRSGKRSVEAGEALEEAGFRKVYNVLHGFEGDLDTQRQRGKLNGWRYEGLPWEQF
ncbi:MAG: rhodanese-like domain-containing protein [Burkholderiaceae bacterium]|nr:rhodanese-like domain-containing protein [Burkholderiaceae bacterium]MEB2351026.1 rhodanese-like domain-containing protein [Burkholderiaceae bacterium]